MARQDMPVNENQFVSVDDEIDLSELFRSLWRKKIIIVLCTALFACLAFFIVVPQILSPPVTTITQRFALKFKGIEKNTYPNGLAFNVAEFTSPQIIEYVFKENKLADFGLEIQDLRDNLVINKSVEGLMFLENKYKNLLKQKELTAEGRQLLQEEYQNQRKKLFESPYYEIRWVTENNKVPVVIQEKVLLDILKLWARIAEEQKGVYLYQVPVVTDDAFYFEEADEEYIVKVDMLRHVVETVKQNLEQIKLLPGALLAETASGAKLTALQIRVNDLLNYQIAPLTGLIRSGGLHVNRQLAQIYTQEQLYNLELRKGVLQGKMALLSDALDGYINSNDQLLGRQQSADRRRQGNMERSTVIPQIGDRFLDQLVALANDNQDVAYRQDITSRMVEVGNKLLLVEKDITYYQELLKSRNSDTDKDSVLLTKFKAKNKRAITETKKVTSEMNEIYQLISNSYLKVTEKLYTLDGPVQVLVTRAVSVKKIAMIYSAAVMVFFCMICFGVLLFAAVAKKDHD